MGVRNGSGIGGTHRDHIIINGILDNLRIIIFLKVTAQPVTAYKHIKTMKILVFKKTFTHN